MHLFEEACERFKTHRARIGLIGLGDAGLPLACLFAQTGFKVTVSISTTKRSRS